MVSDRCKSCNKWSYILLTVFSFFMALVALAPLYTMKAMDYGANLAEDPNEPYVMGWNILTSLPCVSNCGDTIKDMMKQPRTYKGTLYANQWLGFKADGVEYDGWSAFCDRTEAKEEFNGTQQYVHGNGYQQEITDKECRGAYARFVSTAMWAVGVAMLGVATIISLFTIFTCCKCMAGMNKCLRIIVGIFLFVGGVFSAAAVGLIDNQGVPKEMMCGQVDSEDNMNCFRRNPAYFVYILLVVTTSWLTAVSAFSAACCCNPDKRNAAQEQGQP